MEEPSDTPFLVRRLLGDWCTPEIATVQQWVEHENKGFGGAEMTGEFDPRAATVRLCAAQLYDSRLLKAFHGAQMAVSYLRADDAQCWSVFFELIRGRARSWLRRYNAANRAFERALATATNANSAALTFLADCLRLMNLSDWGQPLGRYQTVISPPQFGGDPDLLAVLDATRLMVHSRILFRDGQRDEALNQIDAFTSNPAFAALAPIPRGLLIRMRGILCAVSNRTVEACSDLRVAAEVFRASGYQLGEVQTAFSLARIQVPTDRKVTALWIERARDIVDATEPVASNNRDGRHMPGERADLHARLAELELSRGNLQEAIAQCRKDHTALLEIGGNDPSAVPRAIGYSKRNLGRALLSAGSFTEANRLLNESAKCFTDVKDEMNVFFSLALRVEVLLGLRDVAGARTALDDMRAILSRKRDREKENAIVNLLGAQIEWRGNQNGALAAELIARAKAVFEQFGRDYYYVRALIAEGEVLEGDGDVPAASQAYAEAYRSASILELEEIRRDAESRLERLGVDRNQIPRLDRTDLERRCEHEGFVSTDLSILFADLRGFTAATTAVDPSQMASFIGEFANLVSRCVGQSGGLPIRFLGDCVMALFGVRAEGFRNKEQAALTAASVIYHRFEVLRERWEGQSLVLSKLGIGFGIGSGTVFAGRFGHGELSEFSVIGQAVNLASRLQGAAENGEILLCGRTAKLLDAERALSGRVRQISLKGIGDTQAMVVMASEAYRRRQSHEPSDRPVQRS